MTADIETANIFLVMLTVTAVKVFMIFSLLNKTILTSYWEIEFMISEDYEVHFLEYLSVIKS